MPSSSGATTTDSTLDSTIEFKQLSLKRSASTAPDGNYNKNSQNGNKKMKWQEDWEQILQHQNGGNSMDNNLGPLIDYILHVKKQTNNQ
jgi:hypothetical protein